VLQQLIGISSHICLSSHNYDRIAELLEKTLKINPNFNYISCSVNFCIYQSAFVYLIKAKIERNLSPPPQDNPTQPNPTTEPPTKPDNNNNNVQRDRSVKVHLEALASHSKFWKSSVALHDLLVKLSNNLFNTWEVGNDRFVFSPSIFLFLLYIYFIFHFVNWLLICQ
jgi:hypothetical protein